MYVDCFQTKVLELLVAMKSRSALKRMEDSTFGDIHCQFALACATCCFCMLLCHVEPCSSPRKSLMQSIKLKSYKADDDQVTVVMTRLDEASQTPLQSLSNQALAMRSVGHSAEFT
ncbi:hypothetical protein BASA81_007219 [Batrachochytrium salamandrivorans]|nr:hypothetical protein BASA81_007219 [Batrachochytrium salamandrivorans]